jgi:endonuclease/exonuclease/phosphatase family metal-dependent hydrolase
MCLFSSIHFGLACSNTDVPERDENKTVRILNYNVRNCLGLDNVTDYNRVAGIINRLNADVVAIQELDSATSRSNGVVVLNELAAKTSLHATYSASINYQGGKYGVGILTRENPVAWKTVSLPGKEEKRSLLVVELTDIVICCTHLSLTQEDRLASIQLINAATKNYTKPVFLAGDFNAEPGSPEIKKLVSNWSILNDSAQPTIPADQPDKCIDFILVQKARNFQVKLIKSIVEKEPVASDHLPVLVEVSVQNNH